MTSSKLKDLAYGGASQLVLRGPVPSGVVENFRVLDRLELLTEDMVWQLIGHAVVDPLFLIRLIRVHKEELGLQVEEHHHERALVFTTRAKTALLAVDILSNDCVISALRGAKQPPKVTRALVADELYENIKDIPVGTARLTKLLDVLKTELAKAVKSDPNQS